MAQQDPNNEITLFLDPKERISNRTQKPYICYSGFGMIAGEAVWVNGFKNDSKSGGTSAMKITWKPKQKPESTGSGESVPF